MPSTLYNSVKQSVMEYAEIKKRNERTEERLLFRWKLITILLAIVFIILVGVFSQYLKSINNIPNVQGDSTYMIPLLGSITTPAIITLTHAKNMIKGIALSSNRAEEHFQWNKIQKLYETQNFIVSTSLAATIKGHSNLLFLFYDGTSNARFGLYLHKGYVGEVTNGGLKIVKDDSESRFSTMFNLNDGEKTLMYDSSNCNILAISDTQLSLFEGLSTTTVGVQNGLIFDVNKPECYHANTAAEGYSKLIDVTGIADQGKPTTVMGISLQVFRLYLDEDN